jgi:hypothetical protein
MGFLPSLWGSGLLVALSAALYWGAHSKYVQIDQTQWRLEHLEQYERQVKMKWGEPV